MFLQVAMGCTASVDSGCFTKMALMGHERYGRYEQSTHKNLHRGTIGTYRLSLQSSNHTTALGVLPSTFLLPP